jgi:alkylation response protein AidB-like acyl-CoA dehydrogenase
MNCMAAAAAGLYGLAGPAAAGGLDVDPATFCNVIEIMADGCLASTFAWLQHHGAVRALAASVNSALAAEWLALLLAGARRASTAPRPGLPSRSSWQPVDHGWTVSAAAGQGSAVPAGIRLPSGD